MDSKREKGKGKREKGKNGNPIQLLSRKKLGKLYFYRYLIIIPNS